MWIIMYLLHPPSCLKSDSLHSVPSNYDLFDYCWALLSCCSYYLMLLHNISVCHITLCRTYINCIKIMIPTPSLPYQSENYEYKFVWVLCLFVCAVVWFSVWQAEEPYTANYFWLSRLTQIAVLTVEFLVDCFTCNARQSEQKVSGIVSHSFWVSRDCVCREKREMDKDSSGTPQWSIYLTCETGATVVTFPLKS